MEEKSAQEKEYQKRFNEGYLIAQYKPELAKQLNKSLENNLESNGLKEGIEQYSQDKAQEKYPSWLKDKSPSKPQTKSNRSKDLDKE
ncbi:MAG TPA: hypothetical protein PLN13_03515 [Bacteroidia bacterium]|nr:hypothetical protein [Bacteroidia bacterium]HRH07623.1 hypothetical protein [Bacteroidia bacterium]